MPILDQRANISTHHIWCNIQRGPAESCRQCRDLREKYADTGKTEQELQREHFPDAVKVK